MKIEIWSDIACPFCYIGKRRFEAALQSFPASDKVEVIYRSFELDPHAERDIDHDVHDMLAAKYGMSREQAKAMNANVTEQARSVGLTYRLDDMILTNTLDAHRLIHYAASVGKGIEMKERLLKAYFTDSKHVGDRPTLAALAGEVGLDPKETALMLEGDEYIAEVRADEQEAAKLGIRGVPFFVVNRKYGISGAQPTEVFVEALEKAWEEEGPSLTMLNDSESTDGAAACEDGACTPPVRKTSL
jgi:predicted DsbA family dithiol-disulfide isomerase